RARQCGRAPCRIAFVRHTGDRRLEGRRCGAGDRNLAGLYRGQAHVSGGRREFLGLASAALLVPFGPQVRAQSAGFAPPPGPMHLTRRLRREMVDGTAIEAERLFTIRFVPYSGGFRIEGRENAPPQITGPAQLEDFLRLERARSETGLFPLTLDRT